MDFYMGQALGLPELPAGSPRPAETPSEGVIVVDNDADGMTRRYLYTSLGAETSQVLISEIPTEPLGVAVATVPARASARRAMQTQRAPAPSMAGVALGQTRPVALGASVSRLETAAPSQLLSNQRPVMAGGDGVGAVKKLQATPLAVEVQATSMAGVTLNQTRPVALGASVSRLETAAQSQLLSNRKPVMAGGDAVGAVQKLQATPVAMEAKAPALQLQSAPSPRMGEAVLKNGLQQGVAIQKMGPIPVDGGISREQRPVQTQQASLGGPTTFLETSVKVTLPAPPALGTVPQKQVSMGGNLPLVSGPSVALGQAPPAPAAAAPEVPQQEPGTCPGAVEMPDGRIIEPEDQVRLQDLCELMPFLLESYGALQSAKAAKGGNGQVTPGQSLSVVGAAPGGASGVPSAASQFGPAGSTGGGGFVGSGGGGGPGPVGPRGNQGVAGPVGFGGVVDSVTKTDGDFIVGPGAFVAVPGTSIMFVQTQVGPATFLLNAVPGNIGASGFCQSGQMGIRVDGTDYPLITRLLHTFAGGVGEFQVGQACVHSLTLAAGPHTVEVIVRGLLPGEFSGGLGSPFGVVAVPSQPLYLSVVHN